MSSRIVIKASDDITLSDKSVFEFHYSNTINFIKAKKSKHSKKNYRELDLLDYATKLQIIWNSIRQDDPYAEEALIEVERRLSKAFVLMDKLHKELDDSLDKKIPGITIKVKQPPVLGKISLDNNVFFTFHSIMGVSLLGLHESLISKLKTARKYGLLNDDIYKKVLKKSEGAIVSVFSGVRPYRKFGVTRQDILEKTKKAKEAITILGEPSLDILNKTRHSENGPKSRIKKRIH